MVHTNTQKTGLPAGIVLYMLEKYEDTGVVVNLGGLERKRKASYCTDRFMKTLSILTRNYFR